MARLLKAKEIGGLISIQESVTVNALESGFRDQALHRRFRPPRQRMMTGDRRIIRDFSESRLCPIAICLGLLFLQGCSMLQRPTGSTAQPAGPETSVGVPAQPAPAKPTTKKSPTVQTQLPQTGEASWYGPQHQGKRTASGTIFDQTQLTAAHPSLPFGSKIKVTNLANGKSVEVEINDRGPFGGNRIIDLSQAAAKALGMIQSGTAIVRLELSSGR